VSDRVLVESVREKVLETIERTEHLVSLVPAERIEWRPLMWANQAPTMDLGHLLGHLLDCLAGFCAAFCAAFPKELADFAQLKSIPANEPCSPADAKQRIELYATHIERGFACCADADLARRVKTVFVPDGETLLTLLLGNLEHLINHKYQLFLYLKLSGMNLGSADIYRWRGVTSDD
jgi:hypothetical protein